MDSGEIGTLESGPTRTARIRERSMSILYLPRSVFDELRAHGEETWPQECCGALLGRAIPDGWQVDALVRAVNARTDSPSNRYQISPADLAGIVHEARNRGLEIAGFYHSHPDHPAQPSTTDLAEAYWLGCSYVITEVAQGKAAVTNSYLLAGTTEEDKHFEPQTIRIEDRSAGPHRA
jgi:proteasome lid subunit RPN8/RPN11